jgi:hypothetical protein
VLDSLTAPRVSLRGVRCRTAVPSGLVTLGITIAIGNRVVRGARRRIPREEANTGGRGARDDALPGA